MSVDRVGKLTSIGKYRIIRELGRGGMGVVYLAEDTRLQRHVALKILHPFLSMDEEFVRRFTSEAQAIAALSHRGIVRVHAFEEVDGSLLIDMEYIEGGSLDQLLAEGPRSTSQALGIALRVFEALAACHAQGIVHRDIKPSNILMANDGRVLLTDFGLARSCALASASTATSSSFIGTPKYAAPETWGKSSPTPAGDVYSAGLVLLELLAGRTPYDGDSPLEIMRKTIESPRIPVRTLLPAISEGLTSALERMLAPQADARPATAGEALQLLRALPEFMDLPREDSETIRVTPPGLRVHTSPEKSRAVAGLIMTLLVVALVGGFLSLRPDVPASTPPSETTAPPAAIAPPSPVNTVVAPDPACLTPAGNGILFLGTTGTWRSLWCYDSNTGVTRPLWPSLRLDPTDDLFGAHPVNGAIVAVIRSETNGLLLFRTDGTPEGTEPLAFASSKTAHRMEVLGARAGRAWFNRIGGDGTLGIWSTDGTLADTRHYWGDPLNPMFTALEVTAGGTVFFGSDTAHTIHAMPPGANEPVLLGPKPAVGRDVGELITLGEQVLVAMSTGELGRELYIGEAAPDSLKLLRDFTPGDRSGLEQPDFTPFAGGVIFAATTPEHGEEPWFTDGTPEGTRLLADINPGAADSRPFRFVESGGRLYFSAIHSHSGRELWISDGSTEGTRLVADLGADLDSSAPHALLPFNKGLLFTANGTAHGEELWYTEGAPESTRLVVDLVPGPEGSEPYNTLALNGQIYFSARHPEKGRVLWQSDGTAQGTHPVVESLNGEPAPPPEPAESILFKGRLYTARSNDGLGTELWATDPATGESTLLRDIYPGPRGSYPHNLSVIVDRLYFAAHDGIHGVELWCSDGAEAGTVLACDAITGSESSYPANLILLRDDYLAFLAGNPDAPSVHIMDNAGAVVVAPPPQNHLGPWKPFNLQEGPSRTVDFSNLTSSGVVTYWRTDGIQTTRFPALGSS